MSFKVMGGENTGTGDPKLRLAVAEMLRQSQVSKPLLIQQKKPRGRLTITRMRIIRKAQGNREKDGNNRMEDNK